MRSDTQPLIRVNGVNKTYQKCCRDKVTAIENASTTFSRDRIHIIYGPNGSGKSTFARILALKEPPTKGEIQCKSKGKPDFSERVPVISYYNNFKNTVPFYSLKTAVKANRILRGKRAQVTLFIQMLL